MTLNNLQEYYLPNDSKAVIELLSKYQDDAMIVAGGTFIHGLIARGLVTDVDALIDVSRLGLNEVKEEGGELKIGATTTFIQLQEQGEVKNNPFYGAIKDALEYPPNQVKNSATIGGCVSASCPFFDLPVSFLALNGSVSILGPDGRLDMQLEDFLIGLFENAMAPDQFMVELSVPVISGRAASAFKKLETNANDLAIVNAAVYISLDDVGKCSAARVFVGGGVGESPTQAISVEAELIGQVLTEEKCKVAAQLAQSDVDPLSDHRASAEYRTAMASVLVERALKQALNRLS